MNYKIRKEFARLCCLHGFIHRKQCFFRCIGDGVYQTIRVNESSYIDPSSPYYTSNNIRSKRIVIGLYSIYANLPEDWFNPRFGAGLIDANNLVGRRSDPFLGIQDHYDIMDHTGFDYLDKVNSHENLIQAIEAIGVLEPYLITAQDMCIPYLIVGEKEKALRNIDNFLHNKLLAKKRLEAQEGFQLQNGEREYLEEWEKLKTISLDESKLRLYMKDNLLRNLRVANKFGIHLEEKFTPLVGVVGSGSL